jgi:UDPglucose 6-dehydrogenase
MAKVTVVGLGYVGLTTALGLVKLGHEVVGVDTDKSKLKRLEAGDVPFFEPGTVESLADSVSSGTLILAPSMSPEAKLSEFFFVCVPTPQDPNGAANLGYVYNAVEDILDCAASGSVIVIKSSVPVGSGDAISQASKRSEVLFASNPEFLREGTALSDFMDPDRVVVGAASKDVSARVMELYSDIDSKKISTSVKSAELIKYAANAYLASRLSFVNDLAFLCEEVGANIEDVALGIGSDSRIGDSFLRPGPGWGGSCFPKDTRALVSISLEHGVSLGLVEAAISSNELAFERVVKRLSDMLDGRLAGKRIAAWGLAFKANTDDVRDSPAIEVITRLIKSGCEVIGYDPLAKPEIVEGFTQVKDADSAVLNADALVVLTEWPEFASADPVNVASTMSGSVVLDTRGILAREKWATNFRSFFTVGVG